MSSPQKSSNPVPTDKIQTALIATIIVMVTILGVGVASYYFGKNEGGKGKSPIPIVDVSKISKPAVLGAQAYSWSGKITKIEKSKITFSTTVTDAQGASQTQNYIAVVISSTQLLKWDLTKPPASANTASAQEPISFSQFKIGQQILVQAPKNFNDQNTVDAASINLLITPTAS
jgi:hypothetical protein